MKTQIAKTGKNLPLETMTVKELASILQVKPSRIYIRIWNKTLPIPYRKMGTRILFLVADVVAWFNSLPLYPPRSDTDGRGLMSAKRPDWLG